MTYNKKLNITESQRRSILKLHETGVSSDYVITDWLSPDEKYLIFLDELFDISTKTRLGNIWENFDNFKIFLKHSFEVATNIPQEIKESVLDSINSLVITESNQNISMLKPIVKQMLEENIFKDAWDWTKETVGSAVSGVKDFVVNSYEGVKNMIGAISQGDWKKVISLIGQGALYVARKIRSALYHPIGLILDAVLVATGIGKAVQWIPWAVVVGLDIYELISGNFEDPGLSMIWRLVFLGVDILGLVIAGAAAKTGRAGVKGIIGTVGNSTSKIAEFVKTNKVLSGLLNKILSVAESAKGLMTKAFNYFKTKSPLMYKFFSGIMSSVGKFIDKMVKMIKSLLGTGFKALEAPGKVVSKLGAGKGTQAAVNMGVPAVAIGAYMQGKKNDYEDAMTSSLQNSKVQSVYNNNEL